jgi:hypothetical protein
MPQNQYFTLPHRFQLDSMDSRWTSPILYKSTWSPGGVHVEFNNYCIFGVYGMDSTWFLMESRWSPDGIQLKSVKVGNPHRNGIFFINILNHLYPLYFNY